VLVAHIQRARNSTSHSLLMSESTPPPPGFAPSTAAENEASLSPPPSFAPSTAPADEVRVSPPPGFAPSTETVANEVRVSPPLPFFADQERLQVGIVLPPAWGVSLRALIDDLVLPTLSIGWSATRTRRSDRIASICHSVPKKNTALVLIDLTGDGCERRRHLTKGGDSLGAARRGSLTRSGGTLGAAKGRPLTRGGGSLGSARKGPLTRGGAAMSGTSRGGAATSGITRGGSARGGANVSSSSNQPKGKQIVTTVEKGIEIMEAKRKRKNPDLKP
jgi:hypothetical protein